MVRGRLAVMRGRLVRVDVWTRQALWALTGSVHRVDQAGSDGWTRQALWGACLWLNNPAGFVGGLSDQAGSVGIVST